MDEDVVAVLPRSVYLLFDKHGLLEDVLPKLLRKALIFQIPCASNNIGTLTYRISISAGPLLSVLDCRWLQSINSGLGDPRINEGGGRRGGQPGGTPVVKRRGGENQLFEEPDKKLETGRTQR